MTKHGRGVLGLLAVALMLAWPAGAAESVIKKHVEKGRTALMKKDLQGAGSALRSASEDLGKAARNAPGAVKEGLELSARELKTLAGDVEKGAVTDAKRIDDAAGRAYHALARERFLAASEAWAKKDSKATGRALKDAADHMEHGASVAGQASAAAMKDAATGTREVAGKLIQGSGWTSEEVGRGLDTFGKELANLGKRVGSRF